MDHESFETGVRDKVDMHWNRSHENIKFHKQPTTNIVIDIERNQYFSGKSAPKWSIILVFVILVILVILVVIPFL